MAAPTTIGSFTASSRLPPHDPAGEPFVTIAIPTFNRASWLKDCVASALAQSYRHFEVLVSDNASTDETDEVLRTFTDPRLRVVRQERNIGQAPNWNACLAEAKGDYIVFVSDDDRVAPWLLDRCVTLVRGEPQIEVVVTLSDVHLLAHARMTRAHHSETLGTGIWDATDILLEYLKGRISIYMCGVMIRTASLRAAGGLPADWPFAADLACWVPLLVTGRAGLVNERCGTYCHHEGSLTSKMAIDVHLKDFRKLVDLVMERAGRSIESAERRREIELQSRRYFANHATSIFASHRRRGATLATVLPLIWRCRRDLTYVGADNICRLGVPLALFLLLPGPIAGSIRRGVRAVRRLRSEAVQFRRYLPRT